MLERLRAFREQKAKMTKGGNEHFASYTHLDLSRKKVVKYAKQYDDVDMATLIGVDDSNFPFLIRSGDDDYVVMFWNRSCCMMEHTEEDAVRGYATARYLLDRAYPIFDTMADAERYAEEHNWPRGPFPNRDTAELTDEREPE